jgi:hypothetical protein
MAEANTSCATTGVTEEAGDGPARLRAALFCWAMTGIILVAGVVWLGAPGMFDVHSLDFFPLPDFFAFTSASLGMFFLFRGGLHSLRYRKFGTSILEANRPVLGDVLTGRIRTPRDLTTLGTFALALRCDRRDTNSSSGGSGGSRSVRTECLWRSEAKVDAWVRSSQGICVSFALPANGLRSGSRPESKTGVHREPPEQIEWILRVTAPLRGLSYFAEFPLTVYAPKCVAENAARAKAVSQAEELESESAALIAAADLASIVLGGCAPGAEGRWAEAEASTIVEPEQPFQGYRQPEQDNMRVMRLFFSGAGAAVFCSGLTRSFNKRFTAHMASA